MRFDGKKYDGIVMGNHEIYQIYPDIPSGRLPYLWTMDHLARGFSQLKTSIDNWFPKKNMEPFSFIFGIKLMNLIVSQKPTYPDACASSLRGRMSKKNPPVWWFRILGYFQWCGWNMFWGVSHRSFPAWFSTYDFEWMHIQVWFW